MSNPSLLYSVDEAAELLRIGRTRLYELLNAGELPAKKVGKRTFVPRQAIMDFIQQAPAFK